MAQLRHAFSVLALAIAPFVFGGEPRAARDLVPATNALPPFTAISAKGFVHSTERGFKFPDGTVQTTAATAGGGVPSVNGITGAVTIEGDDATTVTTVGSTIRVESQSTYKRTRIVSPVGPTFPDPLASGTALLNALAAIDDASATNRYLLKIEPGVYDLGTNQLVMKPSVDIEGSGPGGTIILTARGTAGELSAAGSGVVAAAGTELRDISLRTTVTSTSIGGSALWVESRNFRVSNVTVRLEGGPAALIGIMVHGGDLDASRLTLITAATDPAAQIRSMAIIGASPSVSIADSTISTMGLPADAVGIIVNGTTASVTIDSTDIVASGAVSYSIGLQVETGKVVVTNATITAKASPTRYAVETNTTSETTVHGSRLLAGDVWNNSAILAAKNDSTSVLRIHSSMLDSAASQASCYHSTFLTGELSKTCLKEF